MQSKFAVWDVITNSYEIRGTDEPGLVWVDEEYAFDLMRFDDDPDMRGQWSVTVYCHNEYSLDDGTWIFEQAFVPDHLIKAVLAAVEGEQIHAIDSVG